MNLVSKIKKMARKKRRTAAIESKAPTEPEILDENIQNEAYEAKTVEDDVDSLASEELPAQLDVSQLLAYTALPPISPEPPRGTPEKRQKAVTIANKVSNDMVVEDLDNDRANADNIDGEGGSPGRAMDASKIYTIGNSVVSPNMKVRREPVSVKVKGESYLAKIHRKASVRAAVPDIETARSTGERFRRSAGDENWGKYLDEIYPDKMYFDYAKGTSMRSESHLRHSSDDALDYLYDRAMYWKNTGSKTARPNSRAKSTRSVHRKVRSAQSDNSVSRSRSVSSKLYRDSQI